MNFKTLVNALNCEVLFASSSFSDKELLNFFASDLMSDVLTVEGDIDLLITSLSTNQALRTADIVNASGILIVNHKPISPDMKTMAHELGITLLRTKYSIFEACGRIHQLIN